MTSRTSTSIKKILIAAVLVLTAAGILFALYWYGFFLPSWIRWEERTYAMDFDNDGKIETVTLKDRHVRLEREGKLLYEKKEWYVSDMICADIDHDGITEVVLLCWNHGDYGISHPFWEKNQYVIFSEHFYIFEVKRDILFPQWMSSKLIPEIAEWKLNDDMSFTFKEPDGEESTWAWLHWGMERLDQEPGYY